MTATGICNNTMAPVRAQPSNASEMVNMLLFGESFDIVSSNDEWYEIRGHYDEYPGWVNKKMVVELHVPFSQSQVLYSFPLTYVESNRYGKLMLQPGSSLPATENNSFRINEEIFSITHPVNNIQQSLTETASMYLNTPYLWGGRSLLGIDCSGFTQVVYKMYGIKLLRDASQQAMQGHTVGFRVEAVAGDLAFFDNEEGKITHVGIMLNAEQIIHASGRVRIDRIDDYGIINKESESYSHKLRIIKRMM